MLCWMMIFASHGVVTGSAPFDPADMAFVRDLVFPVAAAGLAILVLLASDVFDLIARIESIDS